MKEQLDNRKWFETEASNADPEGLGGNRVNFWDKEEVNADLEYIF